MGRPPLSESGLAPRSYKVLASFTQAEYLALERVAEHEGTTIAELVAQRALSVEL